MGSTIKKIHVNMQNGTNQIETIKSPLDWLSHELQMAMCYGCRRMGIMATNKDKFIELLPLVVKVNCEKTLNDIASLPQSDSN